MKIAYKNQTSKFENNKDCSVTNYPLGNKDIDGCIIELDGRYPSVGRVFNEKCKELFFIINGSGKLIIENKEIILNKEDLILVEAGEKYYWKGKMKMFVSCKPSWYPEQHKKDKLQ
jgi:mannose-6-phosphate isomerase-like protein (cupin superfamily)